MEGYIERGISYAVPVSDPVIIQRLSVHDVAKISDSMGRHGSMHNSIKSRMLGMRMCGQAVTVYAPPGAYETVLQAAKMVRPGNVLVVAAQGYCDGFSADKLILEALKKADASGILVDGVIADHDAACASGIGVFSRGVSPRKVPGSVEGTINIPVYCGGMLITPGDYIVGDDDGTIAVPEEDIWRVIELADAHLAGELARQERTNHGTKAYEMNNSIEKCRNWRG